MALASIFAGLQSDIIQCDNLIAHAHALDITGQFSILPVLDQKQITVAAFLNMFIAWETFLEKSFADYMTGEASIQGRYPVRYVTPANPESARAIIIGIQRYFDYGNHESVKKVALLFFQNGYPFEPHISSMISDLADIRTMRNASAHITSTTQAALESLALRIFGSPKPGIDLYQLLVSINPLSGNGESVYTTYRLKLLTAANLIAHG